jgi:dolichol-phosphate mannosyltransferase
MDISVVIPVYKAENYLIELYNRLIASLKSLTQEYEIIMIDDCSDDGSWEIIVNLAKLDNRVKGYKLSRNFGQHYGLTAGLDHCNGDWVVIMDCDLQDQPEDILRLYQKAQEGYDVVVAKRNKRTETISNRIMSWSFYKIFSYFLDYHYDGSIGNFRIISKKVVKNCREMRENLRFFGALIDWMGFSTTSIEVNQGKRTMGKSSYSFKKKWKLASDAIIAYSDKPLRLSIKLGYCISFLALIFSAYVFLNATINHSNVSVANNISLSIYFIGGLIIANLGIIGTYLGKTFEETKKRPLYIIDKTTV